MNTDEELIRIYAEYREQIEVLRIAFQTRLEMLTNDFIRAANCLRGVEERQHPFPEQHVKLEMEVREFKEWVRDGKPIPSPDPDMPLVPAELKEWIAEIEARLMGGKAE